MTHLTFAEWAQVIGIAVFLLVLIIAFCKGMQTLLEHRERVENDKDDDGWMW